MLNTLACLNLILFLLLFLLEVIRMKPSGEPVPHKGLDCSRPHTARPTSKTGFDTRSLPETHMNAF